MYFLIAIPIGIMAVKLLLDYSQVRFFRMKFNELVNGDRDKALLIMSNVIAKELLKNGGGETGR
jgi:hypothetical protein